MGGRQVDANYQKWCSNDPKYIGSLKSKNKNRRLDKKDRKKD